MKENISPLAAGILQGLDEAIADAKGYEVEGMKKTTIYREKKVITADVVKYSKKKLQRINRQRTNKEIFSLRAIFLL